MSEEGLREAKKKATAKALAMAAFDLTLERGLDGFSIDDVASRAGFSRRTFANHFSCKEEAVTAIMGLEIDELTEAANCVIDHPSDVALLDRAVETARTQLTAERIRMFRALDKLAIDYPSLVPYMLNVQNRVREITESALKSGSAPGVSPVELYMLVGALFGALSFALNSDAPIRLPGEPHTSPDDVDLDQYIDLVFERLKHGF